MGARDRNSTYALLQATVIALVMTSAMALTRGGAFVVEPFLGKATPTSMHVAWETTLNLSTSVEYGTSEQLGLTATGTSITGSGAGYIHHVDLEGLAPDTPYFYKCVSGSYETPIYSFRTPPPGPTGDLFTFVAYSDCQTGNVYSKHEEVVNDGILGYYADTYGGAIEDTLSFTLVPGDLVSTGSSHNQWVNEFFGQSQNLHRHVPLYPALGNHEANANLYYMYFDLFENAPAGLEEHCYWFDYQNVRVITLDSNSPWDSQQQLDWLDGVLDDACSNDDIDFVFAQFHHPHKSESWTPGESGFSTAAVELVEQFSSDCGKPSIHFFGHTHSYSRGQSRDHDHLMVNVASGSGSLDYWWHYPNKDYDEFQITLQEWGFVQMEVGTGDVPWLRLRRISRGNDYVPLDNVITDEIVIRADNQSPGTPQGVSPTLADGPVIGDGVVLQGSAYGDPDGDPGLESHWQVAESTNGFDTPVSDSWKRRENWYRPPNGDGWYSVNTVEDPDITRTVLDAPVPGCTTLYWRVRYRDEVLGWSDWSSPVAFEVGESSEGEHAPLPSDEAEGVSTETHLQWNPCDPVDLYDVYLGTQELLGPSDFQDTISETSWDPGTLELHTTYFWRIDRHEGDDIITGPTWSFTTMRPLPTLSTTEWRFDDESPGDGLVLHAAHGSSDLVPMGMAMGSDWVIGFTDGFWVPHIDGMQATYIQLDDVHGANQGLRTVLDAEGDGQGNLDQFTFVWDLYISPSSNSGMQALWQGNDSNSNNAEFFLDFETGGFWLNDGTGAVGEDLWPHGEWFRLVHRVDYTNDTSAIFVNGTKVLGDDELGAPDWLWCGNTDGIWLLSDDGPSTQAGLVRCAHVAIVDLLVPDASIEDLGGPDARGIFIDRSEWRFEDENPSDGVPLARSHGSSDLVPTGMQHGVDWGLGTTNGLSVPHINGSLASFIWMDNVHGANRGLSTFWQAMANGGGDSIDVNEYTLILDLHVDTAQDQLQALLQGNDTNTNDAEWFLDCTNGGFFLAETGYIGENMWAQGEWFRIALRVDYPDSAAIFVNGTKVLDDDQLAAPDWMWGADSGLRIWLLSDNGPDYDVGFIRCANAALVDGLMQDVELFNLGGPDAGGIFIENEEYDPADLNQDGLVNVTDLLIVIGAWGGPGGDINGDGTTNVTDLLMVIAAWSA